LYDFAKQQFEEKLSQQDESFWVELEEFKAQQRRRFEEFGVCEDDEKQFGTWLCDAEARLKNLLSRCRREIKAPKQCKKKPHLGQRGSSMLPSRKVLVAGT